MFSILTAGRCLLKFMLLRHNNWGMIVRQGHPLRGSLNSLNISREDIERDERDGHKQRVELVDDQYEKKAASNPYIRFGEILHISRPFVYLAFAYRYSLNSWKPWLVSLATDLVSRYYSLKGKAAQKGDNERLELQRRILNWLWYLLRPPMFEELRERLHILGFLKGLPILGYLFSFIAEMTTQFSRFYFFTACT